MYNAVPAITGTEVEKPKFDERVAERKIKIEEIDNLPVKNVVLNEKADKKTAENIARAHPAITNINDGRTAGFPIDTVGKMLGHRGFDISRIIRDIPMLYETSIRAWSEPEILRDGHKSHNNIKEYHHYINIFTDGINEYYIRFTVPETKAGKTGGGGNNYIHSTAISNITIYKKGDDSQHGRLMYPDATMSSPFVDKRLREFFDSTINKITQTDLKVNT